MSQLDLSLRADVSSKHISFLETGRSQPGEDMVLRLGAVMDLSLRDRNAMLRAAGFEPFYEEPAFDAWEDAPTRRAITRMMHKHEPFPMFIMNAHYDIVRMNRSASRIFEYTTGEPLPTHLNALELLLEHEQFRTLVIGWEATAQEMVSRLHQETLRSPQDTKLAGMLAHFTTLPHIPKNWRHPDFSRGRDAAFTLRFRVNDMEVGFLTTLTRFSTPQNIMLEELQIESYFPLDDLTEQLCETLAAQASAPQH